MKNERERFNPIGIGGELDMPRIRHLLKIGLFAATALFLIAFLIVAVTQMRAFAKGLTPLPKWGWVFSVLFGVPAAVILKIPNLPLTNAMATGWISIGHIWMFGGLLFLTKDGPRKEASANQIKSYMNGEDQHV